MATPTIVNTYAASAAAVEGGGPPSLSIPVPNVQPGDWLLPGLGAVYVSTFEPVISGGSEPWSEIGTVVGGGTNQNALLRTWYQVAASSGTYTVTGTSGNEKMLIVYHLRNCDSIDGVSQAATAANAGSTAQVVPSVSPTGTDDLLVGFWDGIQFTTANYSYSIATMTLQKSTPQLSWVAMMSASQVLSASGATGTRTATATMNPSSGSASRLIAIKGTGSTPPPTGPEPGRFLLAV